MPPPLSTDALDAPATIRLLHELRRERLLSDDAHAEAVALVRPASSWVTWARTALLVLGAGLVLAGVIYFFAYNWKEMGRFEKLGVAGSAMVLCILTAVTVGIERLGGKMLLLSGSVLVGVVLAVFGQIYQTGADAYNLFVGWAALMLGWVVVSRFAALWFVWLLVAETGMTLWFGQVALPAYGWPYEVMSFAAGVVNLVALALYEALGWKITWLRERWLRIVLFMMALFPLTVVVLKVIFMSELRWIFGNNPEHVMNNVYVPVWLAMVGGGFWLYRYIKRDFACVALLGASVCTVVLSLIGYWMYSGKLEDGREPIFTTLLFLLVIGGVTTALTFWLRKVNLQMNGGPQEKPASL